MKKVKCPACGMMVIPDKKCLKCGAELPKQDQKVIEED
jgi:hypothetical protein